MDIKNQNCQHATMHNQFVGEEITVVFTALACFSFSMVFLRKPEYTLFDIALYTKSVRVYFHMHSSLILLSVYIRHRAQLSLNMFEIFIKVL